MTIRRDWLIQFIIIKFQLIQFLFICFCIWFFDWLISIKNKINWNIIKKKRKDIKNEWIRMNNDQITFFLIKNNTLFQSYLFNWIMSLLLKFMTKWNKFVEWKGCFWMNFAEFLKIEHKIVEASKHWKILIVSIIVFKTIMKLYS